MFKYKIQNSDTVITIGGLEIWYGGSRICLLIGQLLIKMAIIRLIQAFADTIKFSSPGWRHLIATFIWQDLTLGIECNLREFWTYHKVKGAGRSFLNPTYLSLFGLVNFCQRPKGQRTKKTSNTI